jgi:predicted ATP-dependent serine protease
MNSDAKRRADEATSGREPASPTAPSHASQPSKWDRHRLGPLVALSQVSTERLHWFSPGRLAAGKITIPDGDPGLGKSTLLCETVAPCARPAKPESAAISSMAPESSKACALARSGSQAAARSGRPV